MHDSHRLTSHTPSVNVSMHDSHRLTSHTPSVNVSMHDSHRLTELHTDSRLTNHLTTHD